MQPLWIGSQDGALLHDTWAPSHTQATHQLQGQNALKEMKAQGTIFESI